MKIYHLSRFYILAWSLATICLIVTCVSYATSSGLTLGTFLFGFIVFYGFAMLFVISTGMPLLIVDGHNLRVVDRDLWRTTRKEINFSRLKSVEYTFPPQRLFTKASSRIFVVKDTADKELSIPAFGWPKDVYDILGKAVKEQHIPVSELTAKKLGI